MKTLGTVGLPGTASETNTYNDITMSRLNGVGISMVNSEMRGMPYGFAPLNSETKIANRYLPDVIDSDVASISEADIDRMIYGGIGD